MPAQIMGLLHITNIISDKINIDYRISKHRNGLNKSNFLCTWRYDRYSNTKIYLQILFKWFICYKNTVSIVALTVHKTQALTLPSITVSLDSQIFSPGQAYVALSRCTSWENVQLITLNRNAIITDQSMVNEYKRLDPSHYHYNYLFILKYTIIQYLMNTHILYIIMIIITILIISLILNIKCMFI